jgi:hypothetical protein
MKLEEGKVYRAYQYPDVRPNDYHIDVLCRKEGLSLCMVIKVQDFYDVKKGQVYDIKEFLTRTKLIADSIEEYEKITDTNFTKTVEKVIEKQVEIFVPVEKVVRTRAYYETAIDRFYNWYCKSRGRELDEFV